MGLFDFRKKKQPEGKHYTLSEHYRGYKAFPMIVHGNDLSEKNNELLRDVSLPGHTITFNHLPDHVQVLIDDKQVGAIFDSSQIDSLNKVSAVYARSDIETVVHSKVTLKRNRLHLFVKYEG